MQKSRLQNVTRTILDSTTGTPRVESLKTSYLKIVMTMVNENVEEVGIERMLKFEDFNRLTSEQMIKIVYFLLKRVKGDNEIPVQMYGILHQFDTFGVGGSYYDCGIDNVYHAVKPLFSKDTEIFHYSILLLPSRYSRRTKDVLSYIMGFVLMCDKLHATFEACYEEVMNDNKETTTLCTELDFLKNKICETIQQNEIDRNSIPGLEEELERVVIKISKVRIQLATVEGELQDFMNVHQEEETKITRLNEKLNQMVVELENLSEQVVPNPEAIIAESELVKNRFEAEEKNRQELGDELEKCGRECDEYAALIQHVEHGLQSIQEEVALMEDAKEKIQLELKMVDAIKSSRKKVQLREKELEQLTKRHEQALGDIRISREQQMLKLERMASVTDEGKELIECTKIEIRDITRSMVVVSDAVKAHKKQIELLKADITKYVHFVQVVLPQKKIKINDEILEMYDNITAEFGWRPAPVLNAANNSPEDTSCHSRRL